ncbi:uncharacterized protein LAESUDRAFT_485912 [Laetiporus sulphureus 93-53]|uniref:Uncharacterized protein n=1 Tax=Laetiporus sulphureus 93-53 TaxID=1314785 RepID=A0A165BN00_9APHY|nr:uncharacterized protein LAESUDRAFT_485912 [Laetiporus sulphureus 93-53]KZT01336.1 hypothetical protein LAESUDRAFT_485912 [Laetiporus sulphureus 93-53]
MSTNVSSERVLCEADHARVVGELGVRVRSRVELQRVQLNRAETTCLHWCHAPILTVSRNRGERCASTALPPFHRMGMITQLYAPLVTGQPVSLFAPRTPNPHFKKRARSYTMDKCKRAPCHPCILRGVCDQNVCPTVAGRPRAQSSCAGINTR